MRNKSRKNYWIDRHIQGALATRVAGHWAIFGVISLVLTMLMQCLSNPIASFDEHKQQLWQNQGPFAIVMFVMLPIFLYDTVKLSHRFAGPVLRLRRAMTDIASGLPAERISFRDNDFWRGMANDYNTLIDMGYFDTPRKTIEEAEAELQKAAKAEANAEEVAV